MLGLRRGMVYRSCAQKRNTLEECMWRYSLVLVLILCVGCEKKPSEAPKPAPEQAADAPQASADTESAGEPKAPTQSDPAQAKLVVTVDGAPAPGPFFGIAQEDTSDGTHVLTFADTPIACDSFKKVLAKEDSIQTLFRITTHPALLPDGTTTRGLRALQYGSGVDLPVALTPLSDYGVKEGFVSGVIPTPFEREDEEKGKLSVKGGFSVPLCADQPVPTFKRKDPVEGTSDMILNVAGKELALKGVSVLATPDNEAYELRLTPEPHGCDFDLKGDLHITFKLGTDEPKITLGGTWLASSSGVPIPESLAVEVVEETDEAVQIKVEGKMDFDTMTEPQTIYPLTLKGTAKGTRCQVP